MRGKRILIGLLIISFVLLTTNVVLAADKQERKSQEYDETAYGLMTYADESWFDWSGKAASGTAKAIKDGLWANYVSAANLVFMIVYQLFSLDIIEMTKESVEAIVSGTAGSLVKNLGIFALAVASVGIVLRAYVQQNWAAFFKLLTLVIFSMSLLFSLQAKKLNYIDIAHGLSTTIENAIMSVNPSLTDSDDFYFENFNDNTARNISVSVENKVYDALVYQPYLLLQYGTTDEKKITADDPERITKYLNADPKDKEGIELREQISKDEFNDYDNKNIFVGNAWKQSGYIFIMSLSAIVQCIVFFAIALLRVMLQFGFILMLIAAPIMIFLSMFPTFEAVIGRYVKGLFLIILFKAVTIFIVLIATSFISLGYEITGASNDIYYRIFTQVTFSIATIFMYAKRQFLLNMFEGATPSLDDMGGGRLPRPNLRGRSQMLGMRGKGRGNVLPFRKGRSVTSTTAEKKRSSKRNPISNMGKKAKAKTQEAMTAAGSKMRNAKDYVSTVQQGDVPGMDNPYRSSYRDGANVRSSVNAASSAVSGARQPSKPIKMESGPHQVNSQPSQQSVKVKRSGARNPRNQSKKVTTARKAIKSKMRNAGEYIKKVQMGEAPGLENPYKMSSSQKRQKYTTQTNEASTKRDPYSKRS